MALTYEPIATTTLGSSQATITFSSIPSTYTDLRLIFIGNATNSNTVIFRLNSDTGTNYSYTMIAGNGSVTASQRGSNNDYGFLGNSYITPSSTVPFLATLDIFSYTSSANKTTLSTNSTDLNGSGGVERMVQLWRSTSTINRIDISVRISGSINTGTTVTLYGIKAA